MDGQIEMKEGRGKKGKKGRKERNEEKIKSGYMQERGVLFFAVEFKAFSESLNLMYFPCQLENHNLEESMQTLSTRECGHSRKT